MADDTERLLPPSKGTAKEITPDILVINGEQNADGRTDGYGTISSDGDHSNRDTENTTEGGQANGDEESQKPSSMTSQQKLTFVGVAIMYLASNVSFSILAPFFPYEAERKGMNTTETGFVFGMFALVIFIAAPILGKYLPVIGGKFMFVSGTFLQGGCNILFGFLDEVYGTTLFLSYCFVIRFVEALGAAATVTAGMAIVANTFPDNVAQMGGMLELFSGLGFALGPPLGSLFYGIGGYRLPFIVLGSTAMAVAILNMFLMPGLQTGAEDKKPGSLLSVLRIPSVWIVLIACVWGSASLGFCDPTLSLHITSPPLNVSPSMVGYTFLLIGGLYGATAPIWGYLADKKKNTRIMMALGFYLTGISYLLLGPSPLLKLKAELWILLLALALLGLSIAAALMPGFLDLLMTAKWYGLPDDLGTQSVISGIFNGGFCLGSFLGPTVAGTLVDHLGFDWSATVFGAGNFGVMIMICLFAVWEYQCGKGRRKPKHLADRRYPEIQENSLNVNT